MRKISVFYKVLFVIAIVCVAFSFAANVILTKQMDIALILLTALLLFLGISTIYIWIKILIVMNIDSKRKREKREQNRIYRELKNNHKK